VLNDPSLDERRRAAGAAVCCQHVVCQEVSAAGVFPDVGPRGVSDQVSCAVAGFAACGAGWGAGIYLSMTGHVTGQRLWYGMVVRETGDRGQV